MNLTLSRLTRFSADLSREPDAHLLAAFLAGSQDAFRELVERHAALVFGVCKRILRHQQDAEDAFQAVFVVLARRAADVWPQDAVGAWLHGVASRVALKARTLRNRRQAREHALMEVPSPDATPVEFDVAEIIDRAVRKLPEVYRAAIVACDLEGLSRKDAASRLGWTEGTLSGRLARARKLLADRLRKAEVVYPAAGLVAALGSAETVRGGLTRATLELALSSLELPGSIAPLIHGVTPGMAFLHHKTLIAAMLVAGTLGVGAWTAGAGDGADGQPPASRPAATPTEPSAPVPTTPDIDRIREELKQLEKEIASLLVEVSKSGDTPPESMKQRLQQAEARLAELRRLLAQTRTTPTPPKPLVDRLKSSPVLQALQGRWKIESITDDKTQKTTQLLRDLEIQITGNTYSMPFPESSGKILRVDYTIEVDDSRMPYTIDLNEPGKPTAQGIFAFTAPATTCTVCHKAPTPRAKLWSKSIEDWLAFGSPVTDFLCAPAIDRATGLRIAVALQGVRPTRFGEPAAVVEYQLTRVVPHVDDAEVRAMLEKLTKRLESEKDPDSRAKLQALYDQIKADQFLKAEEAERRAERAQAAMLDAQARFELATARAQQAEAEVELARRLLVVARDRVAAAEQEARARQKTTGDTETKPAGFTIHVRPLRSAETVLAAEPARARTVLEALTFAAKEMALDPAKQSVWVVRGNDVLPVDLAAITKQADATTNYALKDGDKVFVQVKVDK